jgi:flagellar biogenesis protein FliO
VTFGAFFGIAATLALVLGLLAVTLRLLRRFAVGTVAGRSTVRLEVVQRLSLGPRQGIAVVRVGSQTIAVSVGDGGVRPLAVVPAEDCAVAEPARPLQAGGRQDFSKLLREGMRSAGVPLAALLLAAGVMLAPASAHAQSGARAGGARPAERRRRCSPSSSRR